MPRIMLTEKQWVTLSQLMRNTRRVYNKYEHRMTFEGILYRMRTGCPWRDIPKAFGEWNTIFRRFNLWSRKGIIHILFNELSLTSDSKYLFIDGTIIRAHQHTTGAATEENEEIGKSRGGNSTKIHLAIDSHGYLVNFELSGSHRNDIVFAKELVENSPTCDFTVADKGYDSEKYRAYLTGIKGSTPMIPRRTVNLLNNDHMDWELYKVRHFVENAFAQIKHFKAISSRYDKLARNYSSMVALSLIMMWIPKYR
ncbi:IS5 family transposase [Providencia huaxiensis]|uniref:IS5 family transposase n=1 Tax=Providencia huaxiensis TaxID=2027290 RepID=UPI0034DCDA3B